MTSNNFKLFDTHLHIIDSRFPLVSNNGYLPDEFTCEDYLVRMKGYRLAGGAVVSGSFQALDQTYLVDALKQLGPRVRVRFCFKMQQDAAGQQKSANWPPR